MDSTPGQILANVRAETFHLRMNWQGHLDLTNLVEKYVKWHVCVHKEAILPKICTRLEHSLCVHNECILNIGNCKV